MPRRGDHAGGDHRHEGGRAARTPGPPGDGAPLTSTSRPASELRETLEARRRRILDRTLAAATVLATIAWITGVWASLAAGLPAIAIIDTLAWALIVVLALGRSLPYAVRAGGLVAGIGSLGADLLVVLGPVGAGQIWIAFAPALAAVFFGFRGAAWTLGALAAFTVGFAALIGLGGHVPLAMDHVAMGYDLTSWGATAGSALFLATLLALSSASLLEGLSEALEDARQTSRELSDANSELARAMDEHRELEERLYDARRTESLGTLAGGIAHDFNNLLVPILSRAEELRAGLPRDDVRRDDLDDIIQSAVRGRSMVRRILGFSRGTGQESEPVEVDALVREVCRLMRREAPPDVAIALQLDAGQTRVIANPSELHQVLMNLVTNAFRAMEESGGRLVVRTESAHERLRIRVQDTGRGMSPEVMERIFDPYFTTDQTGQPTRGGRGTGLGLPTVRRIVRDIGGNISADSSPGRGTTFTVELPVGTDLPAPGSRGPATPDPDTPVPQAPAPESPASDTAAPESPAVEAPDPSIAPSTPDLPQAPPPDPPSPIRVLVVDDEGAVRRTVAAILKRSGFQVTEAGSPQEALEHLEEPQVVLTDQSMPDMTGLELARLVAQRRPDLPVVLMTGYLDTAAEAEAQRLGVAGIVNKPFDRQVLIDALNTAHRQGRTPPDSSS